MRKLFQLNRKIEEHKGEIVICGISSYAVRTFSSLLKQNIYVNCFITLSEEYENVKIMNKFIYTLDKAINFTNPLFIIVDDEGEKIKSSISVYGIGEEKFLKISTNFVEESGFEGVVTRYELWHVLEAIKERKLIIYGNNKDGQKLYRLFQLCDISPAYFVDDVENEETKNVWELLHENPEEIFVIIAKRVSDDAEQKLKEIGLREVVEYRKMTRLINHYHIEYYVDVQLGHTYKLDNEKYYGIKTFGTLNSNAYKIITLGGSNTAPDLYPFKSWPEILYEMLREKGIDVVVINAGCSSYTASQELLKLERDLVCLEPNLVISYSGINDIIMEDNYKFASQYLRAVCSLGASQKRKGVYNGVINELSAFDWWLKCEYMMYGICQAFDIDFIGICQVMLGGKEFYTVHEKEIILNGARRGMATEEFRNDFKKQATFRNEIKRCKKEFMYDMTNLLNDKNIFEDECHVTEEGNRIIAEEICKIISEKGVFNNGEGV